MEPIFIYYNNLSFDQNKRFTLELSDDDLLDSDFFKKNKNYYITSMSCYIDLTVDGTTSIDKIREISDMVNAILAGGVDFDYKKCYTNNI